MTDRLRGQVVNIGINYTYIHARDAMLSLLPDGAAIT